MLNAFQTLALAGSAQAAKLVTRVTWSMGGFASLMFVGVLFQRDALSAIHRITPDAAVGSSVIWDSAEQNKKTGQHAPRAGFAKVGIVVGFAVASIMSIMYWIIVTLPALMSKSKPYL